MIRALVAAPTADLNARAATMLAEAGDVDIIATASSAAEVTEHLASGAADPDVVVLHEDLGPLPVLDLARDLNHRFPHVAAVLLSADPSLELLRAAMSAGVRSVTRLPLTLSELHGAVLEAAEWSQAVRSRIASEGDADRAVIARGRLLAVAGAKGGVGTTVLSTHLALELQRRDPDHSVCLVDLDLQTGDVRAYLDLSHRRSITDLVEVASELTTGHLTDAMFAHPSGLRVLLPPSEGENAEDLGGTTTARILGGIRARFDTVVVDCGSVSSEPTAVATELADEVLLVCTPDVVSLRGANRMLALWRRLGIRERGITAVLNRASREREVQPGLAQRVVGAPFASTVVPERIQDLEAVANTGDPDRLEGPVREAVRALARELSGPRGSKEPESEQEREKTLVGRATGESGALSAELVSLLLPITLVLLLVWQFALTGYTTVMANHAANESARVLALEGDEDEDRILEAAQARLHGHWARSVQATAVDGDRVEVAIPVPILVPGASSAWMVRTSAGAVRESSLGEPDAAVEVERASTEVS